MVIWKGVLSPDSVCITQLNSIIGTIWSKPNKDIGPSSSLDNVHVTVFQTSAPGLPPTSPQYLSDLTLSP